MRATPRRWGGTFGADLTRVARWTGWSAPNGPATADDILWRRSKLGLRLTAREARGLGDYLARLPGL